MGPLAAGEVVLIPFPFSDLSQTKLRPAVCLAPAGRDDWVLCQVTSNAYGDPLAVTLNPADFEAGGLRLVSYARPGKLFTANANLIVRSLGVLNGQTTRRILAEVAALFQAPGTTA